MRITRAFVSSTWTDLQEERQAVADILHRFRQTRFVGMEYFGANADDTRAASLQELDRCDVYIGIIGGRYGSGITEAEYQRARDRDLPCLIYMKEEGPRVAIALSTDQTFDRWKQELLTRHAVATFRTASELAAKLATDLHNWLFDAYIVGGIAAISAPSAERIQHFLAEYTGTASQPVPFGGRDHQLAELSAWLADPSVPPRLVLAAPAGRGKSALLVHWSRNLAPHDDLAIVFFPVSIRFNTNLGHIVFASLAARLAELHHEPLQVPPDASADLWRGLVASYLARPLPKGRRLLLILDGIDEAADWEPASDLFPHLVTPGTKIIVSARYLADADATSWLRRLGWDAPGLALAMSLDPLTPAGVGEVLAGSGLAGAALSTRVDLVAELHRLSEGDPLLVRLYVASLSADPAASGLNPEDLPHIEPGLTGFFNRWWEDQRRLWGAQTPLREPSVRALLSSLACALGPLRQDDLLQLSPDEAHLNAWTLEDALRPIGRFVVGDGISQGYAFSHPRLGSYFYDRLRRAGEANEHEARFVSWGQQTLTALRRGDIEAAAVPTYLIQYFRPHLERTAGGVDMLRDLVTSEWLQAWSMLDKGSFTGFLADVRLVWQAAARADAEAMEQGRPAPHVDLELRCALCVSSVLSMAEEIPAAFLVALVRSELWTPAQAIGYASNIPSTQLRVETFLGLSTAVPAANRDQLLGAALSSARSAESPVERDALLCRTAECLREPLAALRHVADVALRLERIHALMRTGEYSWRQTDALIDAATAARRSEDPYCRLSLLNALTAHLPDPDRQEAVIACHAAVAQLSASGVPVDRILLCLEDEPDLVMPTLMAQAMRSEDREASVRALGAIVRCSRDGAGALSAAMDVIHRAGSDSERATLLTALVRQLPADNIDAVMAAAESIANPGDRIAVLRAIAAVDHDNKSGALSMALDALVALPTAARAGELRPLLPALVGGNDDERVFDAIRSCAENESFELCYTFTNLLGQDRRGPALAQVLAGLETVEEDQRATRLLELAPDLDAPLARRALRLARGLQSRAERVATLRALAGRLDEPTSREVQLDILAEAERAPDLESRVRLLYHVGCTMSQEYVRERAFAAAFRSIDGVDSRRRARMLLNVARIVPTDRLPEIVAAATSLDAPEDRARVLAEIAHYLDAPHASDAIEAAACAALAIASPELCVRALRQLVPMLPEERRTPFIESAWQTVATLPPETRTKELRLLAQAIAGALPETVLSVVRTQTDPGRRVEELLTATAALPESLREAVVSEALSDVSLIEDDAERAHALGLILGDVPPAFFERSLDAALTVEGSDARCVLFASLGARAGAASPASITRLLEAIVTLPDGEPSRGALLTLLHHADILPVEAALERIRSIGDGVARSRLLVALSRKALPDMRLAAIEEAFHGVVNEPTSPGRTGLLVDMAADLPPSLAAELLAFATREGDRRARGKLLHAVVDRLSSDERDALLEREFAGLQQESDGGVVVEWLTLFADVVPKALFEEGLLAIAETHEMFEAARAMRTVADACGDSVRRSEALSSAVLAARQIASLDTRLAVLLEMGPEVTRWVVEDELTRALAAADTADIISRILELPEPSPRLIQLALQDMLAREPKGLTAERLVARLDVRLLPQAFVAAVASGIPARAAKLLSDRIQSAGLPWSAVLDAVRATDDSRRGHVLHELIPELPDDAIPATFDIAISLSTPDGRRTVFAALAERADGPIRERALVEAWRTVRHGKNTALHCNDLLQRMLAAGIAAPEHLWSEALATMMMIADKDDRLAGLSALAPHLSPPLLLQALSALQIIRDESERADTLAAVLPYLVEQPECHDVANRVVAVARTIPWPRQRAASLARAAAYLTLPHRQQLLLEALSAVAQVEEHERVGALRDLAPALATATDDSLEQALRLAITRSGGSALGLETLAGDVVASCVSELLPWLPTPLLPKAFAEGGIRVAGVLERLRLLNFLTGARQLTGEEALALVTAGDMAANRELVLLLHGGPLRVSPHFVRHHTSSAEAAMMCAGLCDEVEQEHVSEIALERLARVRGPRVVEAFVEIVPCLSPQMQIRALARLPAVANDGVRACILRRLAPRLPPSALPVCLDVLSSIGDAEDREATATRLHLLTESQPDRLLATARSVREGSERAVCLAAVVMRLRGTHQRTAVTETLAALGELPSNADRARLLCDLAGAVPDELLPPVLAAMAALNEDASAAEMWSAVVPGLPPHRLPAVLEAVPRIVDPAGRAQVLQMAMRHAPADLLPAVLALSTALPNAFHRAQLLEACGAVVTAACLPDILAVAATITNAGARVNVLTTIAGHSPLPLPEDVLSAACHDVRLVADEPYRAYLLERLIEYLPDARLDDCLDVIEGIVEPFFRAQVLSRVADRMPSRLWDRLIDLAAAVEDGHDRAVIFAVLANRVESAGRAAALARGMDAANTIASLPARADALRAMALQLEVPDEVLCATALSAAAAFGRPTYVATTIALLAPVLPPTLVPEAHGQAIAIVIEPERVRALAALAPYLSHTFIESAVTALAGLKGHVARRDLFAALGPYISPPLWPATLDVVLAVPHQTYRVDALIVAAQHAPEAQFGRVLAGAIELRKDSCRLAALAGVLPYAPEDLYGSILDACNGFANEGYRLALLEALAPHLPSTYFPAALRKATELADHDLRERAFALFHTPPSDASESRTGIRSPKVANVRQSRIVEARVGRGRSVPPAWQQQPLTRIAGLELERDRLIALKNIAHTLSASDLPEVMTIVRGLTHEDHRVEALATLIPFAPDEHIPALWAILRDVKSDARRLQPLECLATRVVAASHLPARTLWSEVLRFLAQRHRGRLLDGVRVFLPTMRGIGSASVMRDVALAIDDVCQWWSPSGRRDGQP